ncbi:MAG: amidohydrolase family protein [Prolixibacteraceae bacterium]
MKTFAAPLIITLAGPPLVNGRITVDDDGLITGITNSAGPGDDWPDTEFFDGIITPGFVNAHCHLELSHLRGEIIPRRGIANFIGEINRKRNVPAEKILEAALETDRQMYLEGTVACGDISNTSLTAEIKQRSGISWFTFVETFGFHPSGAARAMELARFVWQDFRDHSLPASIVPHSAYSVSDDLFRALGGLGRDESSILSVHNQESPAENLFFTRGEGPILNHLRNNLGIDTSHWQPKGVSSLVWLLGKIPPDKPLLLIHNTFTTCADLKVLKMTRPFPEPWLVICPNSNRYIEGGIPPVSLFRSEKMQLCIGTDSPASNPSLSILAEMMTLQDHFPEIPLEEMLTWACTNGAKALGMDDRYGTLEVGKKPGIAGITACDIQKPALTPRSRARRLA